MSQTAAIATQPENALVYPYSLNETADLVNIRTWQTIEETRRIAITKGANKVRLDPTSRKKLPVNGFVVEPRHRPAIET